MPSFPLPPRDVLLWRNWSLANPYPVCFSSLSDRAIGGTELQMLWHARQLTGMGCRVQVLGASSSDRIEEEVEFLGAADRAGQEELIRSGKVRPPDVVFLEGSYAAAPVFRSQFPSAHIVH